MAMPRQLSALLFELQGAGSPLAKAKVLARAWRTVRELSPADRKLLARDSGFAGAEEILEGLAKRRGGLAPALLLELLGNAQAGGGESVAAVLGALRGHESAGEVAARTLEATAELLEGPASGPATRALDEGLDRLTEVGVTVERTADEALAALRAIEPGGAPPARPGSVDERADPEPESPPAGTAAACARPTREPRRRAAPGWDLLAKAGGGSRPRPAARPENSAGPGTAASSFAAPEVLGALGAQQSLLSRLLVLRRELASFAGSSGGTLQQLVESFPDGWPRRRAVASLLEGGLVAEPAGALALVAALGRERDRAWCLSILAGRGLLGGAQLERALALLASPALRRRLEMVARAP